MNIKVEGLKDAMRRIDNFMVRLEPTTFAVLQEVAKELVEDAKGYAPTRTGFLRSNIQIIDEDRSKKEIIVASSAPYSGFVEFGTSKARAQPFMQPAVENAKKVLVDEIEKRLEENIR